jgi:ABC-type bacteriocin/lantibiotic exporter with double-glycine peptidase domain
MKSIHSIRKIFIRQINENDCGIACLSMIFNYAGRTKEALELRHQALFKESGISLLELKIKAAIFDQAAKCVKLDLSYLRASDQPIILHMINENGNNHYQVCFGSVLRKKSRLYLMADPAHQV